MLAQLTQLKGRVIGVLIEKEITTPDQYSFSLNSLTLGCKQKSSREPIMHLRESEVQSVLCELRDSISGSGRQNKVIKLHKLKNRSDE
ncbi:hypothetical protein GPUN_1435 [Glaciecola punicea ACAM 611]|uniref:Uncharacterized protein n=1 Tax=Glaciecola punicea ACAM 611 TaxID=1121923 RepID=H5TB82_9ALTE|nr:hypothetical protein GPUN_1435 [Glaciecola punicea ACAM 611]